MPYPETGEAMLEITSSRNPIIKEVRSLKNRKDREEKGLFFVEGVRIVEEALTAGAAITYAVLAESFAQGSGSYDIRARFESAGVKCYSVPDSLFDTLGDTRTPQGMLAVAEIRPYELDGACFADGLFVILDGVRDPGNMGTIIRTADAAGFTGVIAAGDCVDIYNPKVLRSTMGSIFHIPVYIHEDITGAIRLLKAKGISIAASQLSGGCSIYGADLTAPIALVIGSEAGGISREAAAAADLLVNIPMPGRAESLNASVAAGIMIFEAVRQRLTGD